MVTYSEVRAAYEALRKIGAPENNYFEGNLKVKTRAIRLQKALKAPYTASADVMNDIGRRYAVEDPEKGSIISNVAEYAADIEAEMLKEVEGIDPEELAIKASDVGVDTIGIIPDNLLVDLGQFFEWDVADDELTRHGSKNRSERRR